ncbi:MAG TPA: trehalase family glycosidase [Candidatus Dormibacteraeota bacterium]
MLRARWADGMVPHVHYDPRHLADYFPGPDWWPGAQRRVLVAGELTSGISNPPVLVLAALVVGSRLGAAARGFYGRVYPGLLAWLRWFRNARTLPGSPLPVMVHPWESGWDNSPRWDFLAAAGLKPQRTYRRLDTVHVGAAQRPTGKDYDSFLALAELLDACDYDLVRYRELSPFCVHDVLIDALWHRAARALNRMAFELDERAPFDEPELEEYAAAFHAVHWDEAAGTWFDVDLVTGFRLTAPTAAGLASLAGGLAGRERAELAWSAYRGQTRELLPVPTAAPGPAFEPERYWRGPVWLIVDWLVADGLEAAGLSEPARTVRETVLALAAKGLHEYFDPRTGAPLGAGGFSFSAAVVLDLLQQKGKPAF